MRKSGRGRSAGTPRPPRFPNHKQDSARSSESYRGRAAARDYIFFSAAFFVTLPFIIWPQVFPFSEVSIWKS